MLNALFVTAALAALAIIAAAAYYAGRRAERTRGERLRSAGGALAHAHGDPGMAARAAPGIAAYAAMAPGMTEANAQPLHRLATQQLRNFAGEARGLGDEELLQDRQPID
jgi:hypothetical protein